MKLRIILPLALVTLAACAPTEYREADLAGPNGNFEGIWVGGSVILDLHQNGTHVKGTGFMTHPAHFDGEVTGRVVRGTYLVDGGTEIPTEFAMTVDSSGEFLTFGLRSQYGKVGIGPANNFAAVKNTWGEGAVVTYLPFDSQGFALWKPNDNSSTRKAIASLVFKYNGPEQIRAGRAIVPGGDPCKITYVDSSVQGPFSDALNFDLMKKARKLSSFYRKYEATVDGRRAWFVVAADWKTPEQIPNMLQLEVYWDDPDQGGFPVEIETIGMRKQRTWEWYWVFLTCAKTMTKARAIVGQDGRIEKIETTEVEEPQLEDFLYGEFGVRHWGRFTTRALIEVKNKTLAKVLAERSVKDLTDLDTKIEQAIADKAHAKETAKDKAQRLIEQNQKTDGEGPDELRERSLIYQEQIEVLKAILAVVKAELANRNK